MAKQFNISFKFNLADGISRSARSISRSFGRIGTAAKTAGFDMSKFNTKASQTGSVFKGVIGAQLLTRAFSGLGDQIKESITLASDLTEVQNVVDTTFGESSKVIDNWATNLSEKFGLNELQAKKFSGTLGAMMKSSGLAGEALNTMSIDLTGLAGDYASFFNLDIEEAFTKIRSGLSGESEPLKQIGKDMSIAGLKAFALSQNIRKSYESMSMAEKYTLRYNYLMSQSKDQIDDFNKTLATSYANQKRTFQNKFATAMAKAMQAALPTLIDLFKELNAWISTIDWNAVGREIAKGVKLGADAVKSFVKALPGIINFIKTIMPLLKILTGLWVVYKVTLMGVFTAQKIMAAWDFAKKIMGMARALKAMTIATKAAKRAQDALNASQAMGGSWGSGETIGRKGGGKIMTTITGSSFLAKLKSVFAVGAVGMGAAITAGIAASAAAFWAGQKGVERLKAGGIDVSNQWAAPAYTPRGDVFERQQLQQQQTRQSIEATRKAGGLQPAFDLSAAVNSATNKMKSQTDITLKVKADQGTQVTIDDIKKRKGSAKITTQINMGTMTPFPAFGR